MLRKPTHHRPGQRGMSLVELMVGITVGLFVLAAAAAMTATQLTDNRRLLLETQVQQDLRMAADIIARDLRRAGHAGPEWVRGVWPPAGGALAASQPSQYNRFVVSANGVEFDYWDSEAGLFRSAGYKKEGTRLQSFLGAGGWQDLTDATTLRITNFTVQVFPVAVSSGPVAGKLPCPRLCPDGSTNCWPRVDVRDVNVTIAGQAESDERVRYEFTRVVRLRNDVINFLAAGGTAACPT
jgi:type IV pilus assembly protein PilW